MKKFTVIVAVLLLCIAGHAQQSLWGGAAVISPEIHPDNTVTFRLNAPNATMVQVTGDFLPTQKIQTPAGEMDGPGVADLVKNEDGIWEYTCEALTPELYYYNFLVDGLKINDPSNVYMIRDVASVMNIFIIDGERADLYKVNDVPHGSVTRLWYDSPGLKLTRRMTVYTPAGYEDSDESYPVFYLLHGAGGDEEAWIALGRTAQILDNLIAQGKAVPMIVVMTNGNASQKAAPGESEFGMFPPSMRMPGTAQGTFEEAFPDVVNYIEKHYRVISDKSARAIAGLSMGGGHSLRISYTYPDMFDYVGIYSAAARISENEEENKDLADHLAVQFANAPKLYYLAVGNSDFLYQSTVAYRQFLDEKGYKYTYRETDGGHIWRNWRIYLSEFAPMLFK